MTESARQAPVGERATPPMRRHVHPLPAAVLGLTRWTSAAPQAR